MHLRGWLRTATVLLVWSTAQAAYAEGPAAVWRANFAQAQADARSVHRPLIVHFYADWCGPCKRMDREVLYAPDLLKAIDGGFVAVKVNSDQHPDLIQRYRIEALPCDLILGPDGQAVSKTEGYQPKATYLGNLARIDARFVEDRRALAAKAAKAQAKPAVATESTPKVAAVATETSAAGMQDLDESSVPVSDPQAGRSILALDGYCPVTLFSSRAWKRGLKEYTSEFQGVLFYFAGEEQLQAFRADPARYAPRLLGCDPVTLAETETAVAGSARFGAFFDGELYLFQSAESRAKFRSNPNRYTRTKQVRIEDIQQSRA